jgi:hypothetical protein
MKTLLLGVVAALALSSLPAAYADDTTISVSAARAQQYQMQPDEFTPFRNTYVLQNGQRISFDNRLTKLYASLDKGRPVRIYATSQTSFVTEAGVRFDFKDDGDQLSINDFQKMPLAHNAPANGLMMARR